MSAAGSGRRLWICELYYDIAGQDENEGFGVCGNGGARLDGWSVVLYNGKTREPYSTPYRLAGVLVDEGSVGKIWFDAPGIQNGPRDGLALMRPDGSVEEFLSYEGSFVAESGPAVGLSSVDILVSESSGSDSGNLLRRSATGSPPRGSRSLLCFQRSREAPIHANTLNWSTGSWQPY